MSRCTFCGRVADHENTKVVEGYTILDECTDCEMELLEGGEEQ